MGVFVCEFSEWLADTEHDYSDKLTLSFDVFCQKKPKSECLVPSRSPDFAGMMRTGHDQSTPFGGEHARLGRGWTRRASSSSGVVAHWT
jgi:hypothetical protein